MKPATLLLVAVCACGAATGPTSTPAPAANVADLKAPGEAKVGDRTRCPVSGEEFVVSTDSPHAEYGGKTYYFCCARCVEKFKADPQKFAGQPSN